MTTPHSEARPPRWAEAIVRLLLAPEDPRSWRSGLCWERRRRAWQDRGEESAEGDQEERLTRINSSARGASTPRRS